MITNSGTTWDSIPIVLNDKMILGSWSTVAVILAFRLSLSFEPAVVGNLLQENIYPSAPTFQLVDKLGLL